jgi:adenylate cyclase
MAVEIERKFLVKDDTWRGLGKGSHYRQGYLSTEPGRTVRLRVAAGKGFLTIKGKTVNATRSQDADAMLDELCARPLIEKTRYRIEYQGLVWEVDEFEGENAGLVVAEVELAAEDQVVALPAWVGEEVTTDPRYYNANLIAHPFSRW